MQEEQPQQDTSPAQPTPGAPLSDQGGLPESETPATPAHEEADAASGQPDDDTAPDADEPGDDVAPEELEQYEQEAPNQPDAVDQPDSLDQEG